MSLFLGIDCTCERNTGAFETPTWDPITLIREGTLGLEMGEADATHRGSGKFNQSVPVLENLMYEAELLWDPAHADHIALWTAWKARSTLDLQFRTATANDIWRAECKIFKFAREEPLAGVAMGSIVFKPTPNIDGNPAYTA